MSGHERLRTSKRLDLFRTDSGWGWRLWSGSDVVSGSGRQNYSRRIDAARGAEIGAGLGDVINALKYGHHIAYRLRYHAEGGGIENVRVRVLDERQAVTR